LRRVDDVDLDEEVAGASQGGTLAVGRWVVDESGFFSRRASSVIGTGQRGTEAVVDAASEAQMLVVLMVGIEPGR
jgi:hypothetical protein